MEDENFSANLMGMFELFFMFFDLLSRSSSWTIYSTLYKTFTQTILNIDECPDRIFLEFFYNLGTTSYTKKFPCILRFIFAKKFSVCSSWSSTSPYETQINQTNVFARTLDSRGTCCIFLEPYPT